MRQREWALCLGILIGAGCLEQIQAAEPHSPWAASLRYGASEDKNSFDVRQSGVITTPGGASFVSASTGEVGFEVDRREIAAALRLPRWGVLGWELSIGSLTYDVAVPSAAFVNRLEGGHGFSLGVSAGVEMLPETLVTPRIEAGFGWRLGRSYLGRFHSGASGETEAVENRLDLVKKHFQIYSEKSLGSHWVPRLGAEIFRVDSKLINLKSGQSMAGNRQGYRIFGALQCKISSQETVALEGTFGDEQGYRLALTQEF